MPTTICPKRQNRVNGVYKYMYIWPYIVIYLRGRPPTGRCLYVCMYHWSALREVLPHYCVSYSACEFQSRTHQTTGRNTRKCSNARFFVLLMYDCFVTLPADSTPELIEKLRGMPANFPIPRYPVWLQCISPRGPPLEIFFDPFDTHLASI